jgi:hypothetical protein
MLPMCTEQERSCPGCRSTMKIAQVFSAVAGHDALHAHRRDLTIPIKPDRQSPRLKAMNSFALC